ncbi:hypothetical protein Ciccas_013183, partial [Cichlidogyrus casuarinus]
TSTADSPEYFVHYDCFQSEIRARNSPLTHEDCTHDEDHAFSKMVELVLHSDSPISWPQLYAVYNSKMVDHEKRNTEKYIRAKLLKFDATHGSLIKKEGLNFVPAHEDSELPNLFLPPNPSKPVANLFVVNVATCLRKVLSDWPDFLHPFIASLLYSVPCDVSSPRNSISHLLSDLLQFNWMDRKPRPANYSRHEASVLQVCGQF